MVGRPDIRPGTEAEFGTLKHSKMVDADDMGPRPGALRPNGRCGSGSRGRSGGGEVDIAAH